MLSAAGNSVPGGVRVVSGNSPWPMAGTQPDARFPDGTCCR